LPWEDLERHGCGWWIEIGVEPLVEALRAATEMSDRERQEMGRRGRQLIGNDYTWDAAATRITDVYRWLTGGEQPECIQVAR
jgi:glycosyltransferase involved in cell wall biosynthesis